MIIKAINLNTNYIIYEDSCIDTVIKNAKESSQDYILEFQESSNENLIRTINKHILK